MNLKQMRKEELKIKGKWLLILEAFALPLVFAIVLGSLFLIDAYYKYHLGAMYFGA